MRDQAGFTLVEILVAMLLMSIMIASVGRLMIDWSDTARRSSNSTIAQTLTANALDRMGADMREAISPQRSRGLLTLDKLRDALLRDTPPSPWLEDVIRAEPNDLQIRSDVSATSPGSECVEYWVDGARNFRRTVYASSNSCSGLVLENEVLVKPLPAGERPLSLDPIFSYDVTYNQRPNRAPVDPNDCVHFLNVPTETGFRRNRIQAVNVNLRSFVASGKKSGGDIEANDRFDIETRASHDYMYAMGCAF